MADTTLNPLAARLATTATGYGAVIDGILNIRTVTDGRNMAALNALVLSGHRVLSICHDPDCDCMVKALARIEPSVKIVPVNVQVCQ